MNTNKNMDIFNKFLKHAWDYTIPLVLDDFIIRNEASGPVFTDNGEKTREDAFTIVAMFIPDAASVKDKISWIRKEWDWITLSATDFLKNYIRTYFKDPLDDHIGITSIEFLDEDPATRRSLSKAAFLVKVKETKHTFEEEKKQEKQP